jgi:hypothetical protein
LRLLLLGPLGWSQVHALAGAQIEARERRLGLRGNEGDILARKLRALFVLRPGGAIVYRRAQVKRLFLRGEEVLRRLPGRSRPRRKQKGRRQTEKRRSPG